MAITVGIILAVLVIGATLGVLGSEWLRRREDVRQTEQEVKASTNAKIEDEYTRIVKTTDRDALELHEKNRFRWRGRGRR